jgi:uncharacterized membrane protein YjgN (DUF898 family)
VLEAGVHNLVTPAGAGGSAADVRPRFSGDGRRFVRLLAKGGLLQLVTFGFYRFWLLTDIRRHLWSGTSIDGDALEYTGRGRELLIGFLFAVAVLAPLFLLYFLAGIEAERYKAFASVPLYVILFLFGQFAVYRARRYRLTRTVWRGVRFWMSGSGWSYAVRSFLWSAFAYLTIGVAYPWRAAALERYKMRNTYYGDMQGGFVGTGWGLFKKGFWLWLILFGLVAAWIASIVVMAAQSPQTIGADGDIDLGAGVARVGMGGATLIALAFVIAWPIYQAIEWRWWAEGVRIGPVEMTSALPRTTLLTLYLKTVAWSLVGGLVVGVVFIVFAMAASGHIDPQLMERSKYAVTALAAVGYLLALMAFGIVWRFYMQHQFWRAFVGTMTIRNLDATRLVSARGEAANAFGEGLLDGLDMGGF